MKNFRSTAAFSLLVLVLVAYTAFEYRQAQMEAGLADDEKLAFSISPDEVRELKIERPKESILLIKEESHWKLKEPIEDMAEDSAVDGLIYSLTAQRLRRLESENNTASVNWPEYGLTSGTTRFELSTKGKSESLTIGSKNAYDGSFYVRKEDELLLGDQGLAQLQERETSSFRSRRVWREQDAALNEVAVVLGNGQRFSLIKAEDLWRAEPKPSFDLDQHKIVEWISKVQDLMPSDFAKENLDEGDKKEFGLLQPSYQVRIKYTKDDKPKEWELVIGADRDDDVYLYSSLRPVVMKTSVASVNSVRQTVEDFRDGKRPFAFDVERARRVEVRAKDMSRAFVKKENAWVIEGEPAGEELDQDKLVQLVQRVRDLEARQFFTAKGTGKGIGAAQIIVRDGDGGVLLSLAWGDVHPTLPLHYVKTNLEPSVVGVEKEKLEMIIDPSMIKKKKTGDQKK